MKNIKANKNSLFAYLYNYRDDNESVSSKFLKKEVNIMSNIVQDLQRCILRPEANVDYVQIVNSFYPREAFAEPFIGFKIGLLDVSNLHPQQRFDQLFRVLPRILAGTNVILREVPVNAPPGFYLITLPVPRSRMMDSINAIKRVEAELERWGLIPTKEFEINVSGRCNIYETEVKLNRLMIPKMYQDYIVAPPNGAYRVGRIQRLNNDFILLRSNWLLKGSSFIMDIEQIVVLSTIMSSIF